MGQPSVARSLYRRTLNCLRYFGNMHYGAERLSLDEGEQLFAGGLA